MTTNMTIRSAAMIAAIFMTSVVLYLSTAPAIGLA